ncbi:MAG: menaquinone biosynthesis decarboxylase [Bacteroidota bacterium]|nr:menaquinone biosynthesis decarboxylase [Bacteroidota bacterium]
MKNLTLQIWIDELEQQGELLRIKKAVSVNQEIPEIADRMMKKYQGGKALLFENTGTKFPVLINAYGSENRINAVFGNKQPDAVFPELFSISEFLQGKSSKGKKLSELWKQRKLLKIFPKLQKSSGLCQEAVTLNPNLNELPILQSWPHDSAPFVTLPMVFTQHPETRQRNIGMYRMQVFNENTTGMHWHRHKGGAAHFSAWKDKGEKMPVAVVLGGDPLYTYLATAPLPEGIDELLFCGLIRRKPVKLVKCKTQDIEVPADADIVIEGYIDPNEQLIDEGPFGDHTGFYSLTDKYPKFHVTAITHKKNAVYPATIVGIPPMEDVYFGMATERLFKPAIKMAIAPELIDFHLPAEGVAHNLVLLKVRNNYPGVVTKTMYSLLGAGQMMFSKILIALPESIDLTNYKVVLNHFANNIHPDAFTISTGPADELEHASPQLVFGGKCMIDLSEARNQDKLQIRKGENLLNYGRVSVMASPIAEKPDNIHPECTLLIWVDYPELFQDINLLLWWILANTDPKRDIRREGNQILWDARHIAEEKQKHREWPNPVVSSDEIIKYVDTQWEEYEIGDFIKSPSLKAKRFVKNYGASLKID